MKLALLLFRFGADLLTALLNTHCIALGDTLLLSYICECYTRGRASGVALHSPVLYETCLLPVGPANTRPVLSCLITKLVKTNECLGLLLSSSVVVRVLPASNL